MLPCETDRARPDRRESRSAGEARRRAEAGRRAASPSAAVSMNPECQKYQSAAAYAARSRRLARRALMIRIASASPLLLNVYATMSTRPPADRPSRRNRDSAEECCRSGPSSASGSRKTVTASSKETPCFAALASAFRGSHSNTGLVYTKCAADWSTVRVTRTSAHRVVRRNCESFLCQNCVTYPPKPWGNTIIYGDTSTHIDVAEVDELEVGWWDLMCVGTRGRHLFPSVLDRPLGHLSL